MADEKTAENEVQKPKSKLPIKMILIIAGVMLMEVGTIVTVKMMNKTDVAKATDEISQTEELQGKKLEEVALAEQTVDNYTVGKTKMVVSLEIVATVESEQKEELAKQVERHKNEIMNAVREVVASAEPSQIKDPKVEVIRRQLKAQIETIVGEGMIKEIITPSWSSYMAE